MDLNFKINSDDSGGNFLAKFGDFWKKYYKFFLLFLTLVAIGIGVYVWMNISAGGQWTEEKKIEYMETKGRSVILKGSDFKKAAQDFESRKNNEIKDKSAMKDVFKSY